MYIISKTNDYYDSVGKQYGIDKSVPYIRKKEKINNKDISKDFHILEDNIEYRLEYPSNNHTQWSIIGFCGKLYVCLRIEGEEKYDYKEEDKFIFSEEIIGKLEEAIAEGKDINNWWVRSYRQVIEQIRSIESKDISNLFYKYKIPVFVYHLYSRHFGERGLVFNPVLKDYQFYRIKDTFTAFQEIQQYISGVIGVSNMEEKPVDDKYKILAAGFDLKTSFRKDKGKKKPRKQK